MRDANATRSRLLAAARAEFAEYGIAGARVERIADVARANKAQIYHHFTNKDGLFDAMFSEMVAQIVEGIPLDVDDLPGYAAQLALGYDEFPDIARLASWHRLERGQSMLVPASVASNRAKIDAIAEAQADGRLTRRYSAGTLLALVLHTSGLFVEMNPELASLAKIPARPAERAKLVSDAVAAIIADEGDGGAGRH